MDLLVTECSSGYVRPQNCCFWTVLNQCRLIAPCAALAIRWGFTRPKTCQASISHGLTGDASRQRAILKGVIAKFRIRSVRPAGLAVRLVLAGMCMRMTS